MGMLSEGLQKGDLDDLVLPLLSIDEYDSKIDNNTTIVVGFYVFEQDAAHDLANFIERSPFFVKETDVSPAPTKDGYYLAFVEMDRTPDFINALTGILDQVNRLCNVDNWQFSSPHQDQDAIADLTPENLQKWVDLQPKKAENKELKEFQNFFAASSVDNIDVNADQLILAKNNGVQYRFSQAQVVGRFPQGKWNLSETASSYCLRLERFLSGPFSVNMIDNQAVIQNQLDYTFLIVKPLAF